MDAPEPSASGLESPSARSLLSDDRAQEPAGPGRAISLAVGALVARHGPAERGRIERGAGQVAAFWRDADGSPDELREFLLAEFLPRGPALDAAFTRFEGALEQLHGHLLALARALRLPLDVETGPLTALDERWATLDPSAHVDEDLFATKLAFVALLNFPLTTLEERRAEGGGWSRRQWAEARLAESVARRVPAEVIRAMTRALVAADAYVSGYDIHAHRLLDPSGRRLFPDGMRLISHWGLRDEIKARYADRGGLAAQRLLQAVLERIVAQEIPASVPGNPSVDWNPVSNEILPADADDAPEPDTRYARWLDCFRAAREADPYEPLHPTFLSRRFERDREMSPGEVERLLVAVLDAPVGAAVAARIAERLGRALEPFDIWYAGFKPAAGVDEAALDRATRELYPTVKAFSAAVPRLLERLGFPPERARFVAERLAVEPARGAGHAMAAGLRDDRARLRTRVGAEGLDYNGYNVAMHELGHNVEQVFSLAAIDHTLLAGVPNVAFTEAFAFLFQAKDLELLGLAPAGAERADAEDRRALDLLWNVREIAGVALVDMAAWRWLYEHPDATPAELRAAVLEIAKRTWNRWYSPLFGISDSTLLAVYSHAISHPLYLPDYPLGHLVCYQVEDHFRSLPPGPGAFGRELERMATLGRLSPDAWMRAAVGSPVSATPLIDAAGKALQRLRA